jgi:hypothetical protein
MLFIAWGRNFPKSKTTVLSIELVISGCRISGHNRTCNYYVDVVFKALSNYVDVIYQAPSSYVDVVFQANLFMKMLVP